MLITTEPVAGVTISGPFADGTYRIFLRETGEQIGSADDYETARDIAIATV